MKRAAVSTPRVPPKTNLSTKTTAKTEVKATILYRHPIAAAKKTKTRSDTAMECNTGLMGLITKGIGSMEKQKALASSGTLRETFIGVNSKMTWLTATESTLTSTGPDTEDNSKMTCNKVRAKKSGSTEPNT